MPPSIEEALGRVGAGVERLSEDLRRAEESRREDYRAFEKRLDSLEQARVKADAEREALRDIAGSIQRRQDSSWFGTTVNNISNNSTAVVLLSLALVAAVLGWLGYEARYGDLSIGKGGGDDDSEESEPGTWAADDDDHDGGTINDDQPDAVVGSPHVR